MLCELFNNLLLLYFKGLKIPLIVCIAVTSPSCSLNNRDMFLSAILLYTSSTRLNLYTAGLYVCSHCINTLLQYKCQPNSLQFYKYNFYNIYSYNAILLYCLSII